MHYRLPLRTYPAFFQDLYGGYCPMNRLLAIDRAVRQSARQGIDRKSKRPEL
jgi:hypothetical protein